MKYKYLFFDLDGTLTDPAEGITNSIIYSLKKFNIEINDRTTLYKFIGPPLVDSFMKFYGFDEKKAWTAVEYYREYFRSADYLKIKCMTELKIFLIHCKNRDISFM